jgi:hypothetical protein
MAYKNMDNIIANTSPTVNILKIMKLLYNYKTAEEKGHEKKVPKFRIKVCIRFAYSIWTVMYHIPLPYFARLGPVDQQ